MKKIYVHKDNSRWYIMFSLAAGRRNIEVFLFSNPSEVPDDAVVFLRLDQQREQRQLSKNIAAVLHARGIKTFPSFKESLWYDDKITSIQL